MTKQNKNSLRDQVKEIHRLGTFISTSKDASEVIKKLEAIIEMHKIAIDEIYNLTKCAKYNSLEELISERPDLTREDLLETYEEVFDVSKAALIKSDKLMNTGEDE